MFYVINYCDIYRIMLTAREYLLKLQKMNDDNYISFKDKQLLNIIGYVMNQLDASESWYFVIEDANMDNNDKEDWR